jgi:cyanate lyase
MEVVKMIFQRQQDLIERKRALGWTNREVANALGVAPGVASFKLNGFIILTDTERRLLEKALAEAERHRQEAAA